MNAAGGMVRLALLLAAVLPLPGCGLALSFDKYDGRWVADVRPAPKCCPVRVAIDVDGHRLAGTAEDCDGVRQIGGRVDAQGDAAITVKGEPATLRFAGENFETVLPGDPCRRKVIGNRGG